MVFKWLYYPSGKAKSLQNKCYDHANAYQIYSILNIAQNKNFEPLKFKHKKT